MLHGRNVARRNRAGEARIRACSGGSGTWTEDRRAHKRCLLASLLLLLPALRGCWLRRGGRGRPLTFAAWSVAAGLCLRAFLCDLVNPSSPRRSPCPVPPPSQRMMRVCRCSPRGLRFRPSPIGHGDEQDQPLPKRTEALRGILLSSVSVGRRHVLGARCYSRLQC
jgi:hypothetical protein